MGFTLTLDETHVYERALAQFDEVEHAAAVANDVAQSLNQALVYAAEEQDKALVVSIVSALASATLGGLYRVFAVHEGTVKLWMCGSPKLRDPLARDEAIGVLRRAGYVVVQRGSWDLDVSEKR